MPASCDDISVREEKGEGPSAYCLCDQPIKTFEQMEKSKLFYNTLQISAHQDIYAHLKSMNQID
jgi:hypothetical protein